MNNLTKSIFGGIIGTAVMTMVILIAPMMGIPKISPPEMLAGIMGMPVIAGWIMHFIIGIIFVFMYVFFFNNVLKKLGNNILKGAVFGLIVFVFAQIMMAIMGTMMPMPAMEGSKILIMVGSIMGHVIFGIVVALIVSDTNK